MQKSAKPIRKGRRLSLAESTLVAVNNGAKLTREDQTPFPAKYFLRWTEHEDGTEHPRQREVSESCIASLVKSGWITADAREGFVKTTLAYDVTVKGGMLAEKFASEEKPGDE